jgi:hypothetical protein
MTYWRTPYAKHTPAVPRTQVRRRDITLKAREHRRCDGVVGVMTQRLDEVLHRRPELPRDAVRPIHHDKGPDAVGVLDCQRRSDEPAQ